MSFISIKSAVLGILFCIIAGGIFLNYHFKKKRKNNDKKARFNSLPKHYSYCFCLWLVIFFIGILSLQLSILLKLIFLSIFIIGNFFFNDYPISDYLGNFGSTICRFRNNSELILVCIRDFVFNDRNLK